MYEMIKMKATQNQRIRVGSEKKDIKKDDIVEVRKTESAYFVGYWFIEIKMEDKKPVAKIEKKEQKKNLKSKKK